MGFIEHGRLRSCGRWVGIKAAGPFKLGAFRLYGRIFGIVVYDAAMDSTAEYTCPSCGEPIMIGVDPSGGAEQEYVEDCPVCCRPNVISVWFDEDGSVTVDARSE